MGHRLTRFSGNLDCWAGAAGRWAGTHWPWMLVWAVGLGLCLALVALGLGIVLRGLLLRQNSPA